MSCEKGETWHARIFIRKKVESIQDKERDTVDLFVSAWCSGCEID